MPHPSLYDILYGNLANGFDLNAASETDQVILSAPDNTQHILNCRVETLVRPPDYGLPDTTAILQRILTSARQLMGTSSVISLKHGPRLQRITVMMLDRHTPGGLRYITDTELKDVGLARYGTKFMPEGKVLIRRLRRQQYLDTRSAL